MRNSADLFLLIQSLSKVEKMYFKKYTSMHVRGEVNNYTRLFNAFEKQKKYNEKKIISSFRNERFVKQFSVAKNYLYNLLLESLESFHESAESKLNSAIERVDILYKKRLNDQAAKIISSAKKIALHYEKHLHYLALVQRELLLISAKRYAGTSEEEIAEVFQGAFSEIARVKNVFDYWQLNVETYYHIKQKGEYVYIVETTDSSGRQFYRVRVGQLSVLEEANKLSQKLSESGYPAQVYP